MSYIGKKLILPIMGKAGHGKDAFAEYVIRRLRCREFKNVLVIKYGDFVKFVCREYMGWDGEKDEYGRSLLQKVGTDIGRKNNENVWISMVVKFVEAMGDMYDCVIIPDARFFNEIDCWMNDDYYTYTIRVSRENEDGTEYNNEEMTETQKQHISENELNEYVANFEVVASTLDDLRDSAMVIIDGIVKDIKDLEGV